MQRLERISSKEKVKIKILIWGFSGAKRLEKPANPTKEDYKFARMSHTDRFIHLTRDFDGLKNKTIEVADVYSWADVTRFFYKDYCCVIGKHGYKKV